MRGSIVPLSYLLKFIEEDAPFGDITSEAIIPENLDARAVIIAKQNGVIAGIEEARSLFEYFNVEVKQHVRDGDDVEEGEKLLEVYGNARKILLVERTALNIIGRMSGIATMTKRILKMVRRVNEKVRIAGTRKTLLKPIDKKAILIGGGEMHRFSLSDAILIKDNHLSLVPLEDAVRRAKAFSAYKIVEVEVDNVKDALRAAKAGADAIMLDNMHPERVKEALEVLKAEGIRESVIVEVSGNICEDNVLDYAKLDVDVISIGALTHSVKGFDVSLEIL